MYCQLFLTSLLYGDGAVQKTQTSSTIAQATSSPQYRLNYCICVSARYLCSCRKSDHGYHRTLYLFTAVTYPTWRFLKRIVSDFGSFSCESMAASLKELLTSPAPLQFRANCFKATGNCLWRAFYVHLFGA